MIDSTALNLFKSAGLSSGFFISPFLGSISNGNASASNFFRFRRFIEVIYDGKLVTFTKSVPSEHILLGNAINRQVVEISVNDELYALCPYGYCFIEHFNIGNNDCSKFKFCWFFSSFHLKPLIF